VWARFNAPAQTGPGAHPASCTMGIGSFPGVKSGRGATLTPHPLLVLLSRKSRAVPLLPLWAVRPVQSLSACTTVHSTLFFISEQTLNSSQFSSYSHLQAWHNAKTTTKGKICHSFLVQTPTLNRLSSQAFCGFFPPANARIMTLRMSKLVPSISLQASYLNLP